MDEFGDFLRRVGARVTDFRRRRDVLDELLDHLQQAAADLEAGGMPAAEARRQAIRALGDPEALGRSLERAGVSPGSAARSGARIGAWTVLALMAGWAALAAGKGHPGWPPEQGGWPLLTVYLLSLAERLTFLAVVGAGAGALVGGLWGWLARRRVQRA